MLPARSARRLLCGLRGPTAVARNGVRETLLERRCATDYLPTPSGPGTWPSSRDGDWGNPGGADLEESFLFPEYVLIQSRKRPSRTSCGSCSSGRGGEETDRAAARGEAAAEVTPAGGYTQWWGTRTRRCRPAARTVPVVWSCIARTPAFPATYPARSLTARWRRKGAGADCMPALSLAAGSSPARLPSGEPGTVPER